VVGHAVSSTICLSLFVRGAGSVIQHLVANDGNTQPKLFRAGITSSSYLPPQYTYNHSIIEVKVHLNRLVSLTDVLHQEVFEWVAQEAG